MNRKRKIHAFLTFIIFLAKVSYEPHNQKDFSLVFLTFSKD